MTIPGVATIRSALFSIAKERLMSVTAWTEAQFPLDTWNCVMGRFNQRNTSLNKRQGRNANWDVDVKGAVPTET